MFPSHIKFFGQDIVFRDHCLVANGMVIVFRLFIGQIFFFLKTDDEFMLLFTNQIKFKVTDSLIYIYVFFSYARHLHFLCLLFIFSTYQLVCLKFRDNIATKMITYENLRFFYISFFFLR